MTDGTAALRETASTFAWREGTVRWWRHGDGPPVVLCHGTPWSSRLWDGVTAALASHRTVYRWDLIGYGVSEQRAGQDVSLGAQGELFAALLDEWRLEDPDVVAHDFGGAISLRALLLHDAVVRSLTLIDPVALAPWGSPFFNLVGEHTHVFEQLPPTLHTALVGAYIRGASYRGLTEEQLEVLVAPWTGTGGQAAFYRQIAQAAQRFTDDIEPHYGEVDVPVHIIWGTEDSWIPVDRAHRLAAAIPDADLSLIGGAGHLIQLDAPAELSVTIDRWLAANR